MKERTPCKRIQKRTPEGVLDRSGVALYGVVDQRIILRDVQGVPADALEIGEQLGEHHADLAGDVLFLHALHLTAAQVHADFLALLAQRFLAVQVTQGSQHLFAHAAHRLDRALLFVVETALQMLASIIFYLDRIDADAFDINDLEILGA